MPAAGSAEIVSAEGDVVDSGGSGIDYLDGQLPAHNIVVQAGECRITRVRVLYFPDRWS